VTRADITRFIHAVRDSDEAVVDDLVAGLVVFVGLVACQVRAIIVSPFPGLRAIEGDDEPDVEQVGR
jgi:hypothetical protein